MTYAILRSRRRTMCLEISRDGKVAVRAPLAMPLDRIEAFVASRTDWIQKHLAALPPPPPMLTAEEIKTLRTRAQQYLPERVAFYSPRMGLTPTSIKITSAKHRFGSCSAQNGLCFSLYLMQYPVEAIDYVVVHELAHIRHHNHSTAFYDLVATYLPDHKARRALLRSL